MSLITLEQYAKLNPRSQGYAVYMQGAHDGSELQGIKKNPYPEGSSDHAEWDKGQMIAVLEAQDSEE